MIYKVEFEISCTTAKEKEIKQQLKYLQFPDIDDVVSFPNKIKVERMCKGKQGPYCKGCKRVHIDHSINREYCLMTGKEITKIKEQ